MTKVTLRINRTDAVPILHTRAPLRSAYQLMSPAVPTAGFFSSTGQGGGKRRGKGHADDRALTYSPHRPIQFVAPGADSSGGSVEACRPRRFSYPPLPFRPAIIGVEKFEPGYLGEQF